MVVQLYSTSAVQFFKGLGNGTFATGSSPQSLTSGNFVKEIASADLNGDGKLDLIVAESGVGLDVCFGNGNGTFAARQVLTAVGTANALVIRDIDGINGPDIVAGADSGAVFSFLNSGSSAPTVAGWITRSSSGPSVEDLHLADLNGDGRLDAVTTYFSTTAYVWIASTTPGVFTPSFPVSVGNATEHTLLADLDGDGRQDLITGGYGGNVSWGTSVAPYFGNPLPLGMDSTGAVALNIQATDLDADGDLDLVKGSWGTGIVFLGLNQGGRVFAVQAINLTSQPINYIYQIQARDLNGDGLPELIGTSYATNRLFVLRSTAPTPVSTFTFVVNQPPVAAAIPAGAYSVSEGGALSLDGSASTDPDNDPLTYSWDVNGDAVFGDASGVSPTLSWAQLNALGIVDGPSTRKVGVRVSDGQGHTNTSAPVILTVSNVAPSNVVLTATPDPVDENDVVTISGTFDDPGTLDVHRVLVSWGDRSFATIIDLGAGVLTFSAQHQYQDNPRDTEGPTYTVTASVSDQTGAELTRSLLYGGPGVPDSIIRSDLDGTGATHLVADGGFARDIEVDAAGGKIYWADATNPGGSNQLYRANLDGSGREVLATTTSGIAGVALDLTAGKVYFGDVYGLYRANLDGSGRQNLESGYMFNDVEVYGGKVYWSNVAGIERANLDGTAREALVSGNYNDNSIVGLDVVGSLGKIYWADQQSRLVKSANLDGTGIAVFATDDWGARGVVVDAEAGYVYWGRGDSAAREKLDGTGLELLDKVPVDILTIQLAGSDSAQSAASAKISVEVLNVGPTPSFTTHAPVTSLEGTTITVTGASVDQSPIDNLYQLTLLWYVTKNGNDFVSGVDETFSFTPDDDGIYGVTLISYDKDGGHSSVTETVTVTNVAPSAFDDVASTDEGSPVTVGVLDNDSDPAGANDPFTVTAVTQGANGSVVINGDGTLTYSPNAGFSGTDSFTYTESDGDGGVSTATVAVTVVPISGPLSYQAPTGGGPSAFVLRLDGGNLDLVDESTQSVVATRPLANITEVRITGADGTDDQLTIDYGAALSRLPATSISMAVPAETIRWSSRVGRSEP